MLKQFRFLDDLSEDQLELLAKSLMIRAARKRAQLLAKGATEEFSLLLLKGKLLLSDREGKKFTLQSGNELASGPIAPALPRQFDVLCLSDVLFLEIDNNLLRDLREANRQADEIESPSGFFPTKDGAQLIEGLLPRMRQDLQNGRLQLPSLPDIAVKIGKAINDEATDAHEVAAIIQSDPAMTAKLLRVANSAFYAVPRPAVNCAEAVVRLGFKATYKLVLSFALREVFLSRSKVLQSRMREVWRHSVKVASVCYVLAKLTRRFDPEQALLCGLVHDIGVVPLISYAARIPALASDAHLFDQASQALRGEIGSLILRHWRFPEGLALCAQDAEDWYRDPAPQADYCDLLLIAQIYSYIGTEMESNLPSLTDLPSFKKLELGELTPERRLEILEPVRDQLVFAESMLS
jgi:HD-like signal output (HDOD) protein